MTPTENALSPGDSFKFFKTLRANFYLVWFSNRYWLYPYKNTELQKKKKSISCPFLKIPLSVKNDISYLEMNVSSKYKWCHFYDSIQKTFPFGVSPEENFLGLTQTLSFASVEYYSLTPSSELLKWMARENILAPKTLLESYRTFHLLGAQWNDSLKYYRNLICS